MPDSSTVDQSDKSSLIEKARNLMEEYNVDAEAVNVWLRTQKHGPTQLPWFTDPHGDTSPIEATVGHEAANRMKPVPHRWAWKDVSPFVDKMSGLAEEVGIGPIEVADRQSVMFLNPGLNGRIATTNTIRVAVSVYNPCDDAGAHVHSPNASRTILSANGGYTTIDGERCDATRGDVILTPNGAWHHHGNDGSTPVVWLDTLDWPLIEYLDSTWIDKDYVGADGNSQYQHPTTASADYSARMYGHGGILPTLEKHDRGFSTGLSPMLHYKGSDILAALYGLRDETGDPYEGIRVDLVNPVTGGPVFPTLNYSAQMIRSDESTNLKRETASSYFIVMDGSGYSEVGSQRFEWSRNDVVCIPGFTWRRHVNTSDDGAILYSVSDSALMKSIHQYRAQGVDGDGRVVDLG